MKSVSSLQRCFCIVVSVLILKNMIFYYVLSVRLNDLIFLTILIHTSKQAYYFSFFNCSISIRSH